MTKLEEVKKSAEKILGFINVSPKLTVEEGEEGIVNLTIEGDDLNFLIGYRGESLDALQTLLGLMIFKKMGDWTRVIVDINGYRKQKMDKIEQITKTYIDKVRFFGKDVEMSPMTPSERRQVHTFIADYDDITSESTGEGQNRRVVLKPKKG
jgi:spoIIIJ-associated protein